MKTHKKLTNSKTKKSLVNNHTLSKGGIDAGTVYAVLLLGVVLGGAYMMLGNIDPNLQSPDQDQPVIVKSATDQSVHSNLQLKDFGGVTLTPTPTPSPSPTPTPTPVPPAPPNGGGNGPLPLPLPGGGGGGGSGGGGGIG